MLDRDKRLLKERASVNKGWRPTRSIRCSEIEYLYIRSFLSFLKEIKDLYKYVLDIDKEQLIVKVVARDEIEKEKNL